MTKGTFYTKLRRQIKDTGKLSYTDSDLDSYIEEGIRFVLNSTHPNVLKNHIKQEHLEVKVGPESVTNDKDVDTYIMLSEEPFDIVSVKILGEAQRYATEVNISDLKKYENKYLHPTMDSPIWYQTHLSGMTEEVSKVISLRPPMGPPTTVEVLYLKQINFTSLGNNDEFEFEQTLVDALSYIVEGLIWKSDGRLNESGVAMEMGTQIVNMLNQKFLNTGVKSEAGVPLNRE